MSRDIVWTIKFKKDYKLAMKRNRNIELLDDIIRALSRGETLPEKNKDHELSGDWGGHRECPFHPENGGTVGKCVLQPERPAQGQGKSHCSLYCAGTARRAEILWRGRRLK